MKTILLTAGATLLSIFFIGQPAHAQDDITKANAFPKQQFTYLMQNEKAATPHASAASTAPTEINRRALKFVSRHFSGQNIDWLKAVDGTVCKFDDAGATSYIYFDTKGNFVASMKRYTEELLDRDIKRWVHYEYDEYKIVVVHEISTLANAAELPLYLIVIEKPGTVKWIRIKDGKMDEYNYNGNH